ncbi:MAG: FkbM family methyltransferase [Planctomycetota bacterium]
MMRRAWRALTTWLMLAQAYEESELARRVGVHPRWELLREKLQGKRCERLRRLPGGFTVRENRCDMGVLVSMPLEYGILEWNFRGREVSAVDAGANIGAFAVYLDSFARVRRYVGIEAAPGNFSVLRENTARLGRNFASVRCALADEGKEVVFDLGGSPASLRRGRTGERLRGMPLDEVEEVREAGAIDILKIDVEGDEEAVLKGGKETLARTSHVVMELHHRELGEEGVARVFEMMKGEFDHVTYQRSPGLEQTNVFFRRRGFRGPAGG